MASKIVKSVKTEQQLKFLEYYMDPKSESFSNAYASALRAGYTKSYAHCIMGSLPNWLSESKERRKRMLAKAESKLELLLDSADERVVADISKFIAKTQGKDEGYSERTELTGKGGETLTVNVIQYANPDPVQVQSEDISITDIPSD